jgi:NAD(P)-dependent dehydrogenase (short-subunit alcohol dehydrogenase family)
MAGTLDGRVAIVTGAASGMGRVMARALAGAGAKIAAVDIDEQGLDRLLAEDVFAGLAADIPADIAQTEPCLAAVTRAVDAFGRLDILVNCAGVSMAPAAPKGETRAKFHEADPEGWRRIVTVNTIGSFLMARFAAVHMVRARWGRIINVTTSFDTMLAGGLSAYGASKSALEANTVSWSRDLDGTGVTVNTLVPGGPADTNFFPPGVPRPPSMIDPQVMALPVVWLASPQSDGITGARFIAKFWDASLPANEAAAKIRTRAAWPDLAEAASQSRGFST